MTVEVGRSLVLVRDVYQSRVRYLQAAALGLALSGCHERASADRAARRASASATVQSAAAIPVEKKRLWDCSDEQLEQLKQEGFDASKPFTRHEVLPLQWRPKELPRFELAPDGWSQRTFEDHSSGDRLVREEAGFCIILELGPDDRSSWSGNEGEEPFLDEGIQIVRRTRVRKLKGDVDFDETRFFPIVNSGKSVVRVELLIMDMPAGSKTAGEWLALVRRYYPLYQELCQNIVRHVAGSAKGLLDSQ